MVFFGIQVRMREGVRLRVVVETDEPDEKWPSTDVVKTRSRKVIEALSEAELASEKVA